jgi:polyhydroxyalkanoate synthesis regulator phasin
MLVEDTAAFIEQLEVLEADRRAKKRRRRLARAEVEVMRAELEARVVDDAMLRLARDLVVARELEDAHGERAIVRELRMVRGRLRVARHEVAESRERLQRLRREVSVLDDSGRRAKVFRLHSARHHLECSERRFARLSTSQADRPVLVAKRDGRHWWWYLDRFWWDDEGLSPRDVAALVGQQVLGLEPEPTEDDVSHIVRFAVWCRDRGRCVDCRSSADLGYDQIIPFSKGGLRWIANVELRCTGCRERRMLNTARTQVSRAQIESTAFWR